MCSCSYNGTLGILNIDPKINCHLCVLSFFHIDWSFHMYCCRFLTNMTKFGISLSLYVLMNPVFVKWCSQKYWKGLFQTLSPFILSNFVVIHISLKEFRNTKQRNRLWFGIKIKMKMICNIIWTRYCWLFRFCHTIIKEDVLITRPNHQLKFAVHCSQVIFGFKSRIKFAISLCTCSFRMFTAIKA